MFRISQPIHIFMCMWMMKLLAGRKHFIADAPGSRREREFREIMTHAESIKIF